MDYQASWVAAYRVIKKQTGGIFKTTPEQASVLITEAVLNDPGSFPPNSINYLSDLFGGSNSSDSNSFNSTKSSDNDKLISAGENAVMFGNQGIYDVINPANSDPNSVVDQIENTIDQQPTPDYVAGPDFNNPVPGLPSPESKAFDSLTNPNPILGGDGFEFGEVGVDALSIDSTLGADFTTIEDLQGLVAAGGYDSIDSMNESLLDSLNSIFEVADIPMF